MAPPPAFISFIFPIEMRVIAQVLLYRSPGLLSTPRRSALLYLSLFSFFLLQFHPCFMPSGPPAFALLSLCFCLLLLCFDFALSPSSTPLLCHDIRVAR
ncbi:hypothetical protein FN846DRAFT_233 [Sphaerosporella brunnea]|uniref:Uncharacterized protein n=1 Tax=Sphaerosporella brunnea TaxID=1250544 RepID=A0A5J5FCU1_9PEZI|nr:hypothetical protein FN846DRAFT_233 [Sphaerosporella brunnea]